MIVEDGGEGGKLTVQIENSKIRFCRQVSSRFPSFSLFHVDKMVVFR